MTDQEDTGRPQDQGRRHRRKGAPSPESQALLARYQESMRRELAGVLEDLEGVAQGPGLDGQPMPNRRPSLGDRMKLWDLGIKLARELGAEVDAPAPSPTSATPGRPARAATRVPRGGW